METLQKVDYVRVVKDILLKQLEGGFEYDDVQHRVVFDDERQTYLLLTVGRDNGKKVYDVSIAIRLTPEGKVNIEYDMTDYEIKKLFLAAGIEYKDII